jgi:hypothetical protein
MAISIRNANSTDLSWIISLLREGSDQGYFAPTVNQEASHIVAYILNNGIIQMMKVRDGGRRPVTIPAYIRVAEFDGKPASFLLCLVENNEIELHLAGTIKSQRNKNCFRRLVANEVHNNSAASRIYARCYEKSTYAKAAFVKEGFQVTKDGEPCELTFRRSVSPPVGTKKNHERYQLTTLKTLRNWIENIFKR